MRTIRRVVEYLWALPNTMLGLVLGALSFQRPRLEGGALVFDRAPRGFLWAFGATGYRAITSGHVVLSRVPLEDRLLRHELHHVAQYEILGPLYLPTYVAIWLVRGYRHHPFEEEARAAVG